MKSEIKVSIILPTLNEKKNLEILIPSIVKEFDELTIQDAHAWGNLCAAQNHSQGIA